MGYCLAIFVCAFSCVAWNNTRACLAPSWSAAETGGSPQTQAVSKVQPHTCCTLQSGAGHWALTEPSFLEPTRVVHGAEIHDVAVHNMSSSKSTRRGVVPQMQVPLDPGLDFQTRPKQKSERSPEAEEATTDLGQLGQERCRGQVSGNAHFFGEVAMGGQHSAFASGATDRASGGYSSITSSAFVACSSDGTKSKSLGGRSAVGE